MNVIPKMIAMTPAVNAKPVKLRFSTILTVMECKEYGVTMCLNTRADGSYEQIWTCTDAPGWFRDWAGLRARMINCYVAAVTGH